MALHRNTPNSDRHNPKGFEDASNSTVLSKDASGNIEWVSKDDVGGSQGPQGIQGEAYDPAQVLIVQKDPQVGQYSTINDALAAITDASASKRYQIRVEAGNYTETSTIVCKPYVSIEGSGMGSTVVTLNFSGNHGVRAVDFATITKMTLTFPDRTNTGYALIYHENTSSAAGNRSFTAKQVGLGESDILVKSYSNTLQCQINIQDCNYGGTYGFNYGFVAQGAGSQAARVIIQGVRPVQVAQPRPFALFHASGTAAEIVASDALANSGGNYDSGHSYGAGTLGKYGCYAENGANIRIVSGTLRGWEKAIYTANVGTGPIIHVQNCYLDRNQNDVYLEHPDTTGAIMAQCRSSAIYADPAVDDITLLISDIESGQQGAVNYGKMRVGANSSELIDLAYLGNMGSVAGCYSGGLMSVNSGLTIDIAAGVGYFYDAAEGFLREITWTAKTAQAITANSNVYIVIDENGDAVEQASISKTENVILLGRVVTAASSIRFIENLPARGAHGVNKLYDFHRNTFGCVYESGSTVAENGSVAHNLDVGSGVRWFMGNEITTTGGAQITFTQLYQNGSGGWTETTLQTVNNTQYDDGDGTLASLTASYYSCRYLYIVGSDADSTEKYYLQLGQAEHATQNAAEAEDVPTPPSWILDGAVIISRIVVQQGATNIISVTSLKPTLGGASTGGGGAASDHGNLTGLSDDDHTQYVLANGGRTMTGDLNMGTNAITNVGLVDGVDISAHASRHLPTGADPLTTAAGSSINATNATGTANSLSRSDHTHKVTVQSIGSEVSLQDSLIGFHSAGVIYNDECVISDAGGGAVDISAGTVYVRASAASDAALYAYSFAGTSGLALTDTALNYIYLNYNSGSPNVTATTTKSTDRWSKVLLGTVHRDGTTLHIAAKERMLIGDHAGSMSLAMRESMPYARLMDDGGGLLTEVGTRNIAISAFNYWHGLERGSIAAVNTSTGDQFKYWYNRASWTSVTGQTAISNTQYDNSGTLTSLTTGYYRADFVYLESDGDIEIIYGAGEYATEGQALLESPPLNLPAKFSYHAIYIGKIIIQQGASSFSRIISAFTAATEDFAITDHAQLANIGTNTHGQIDTHIASTSNPHSVTVDQVTPTTTKGDLIVENGSNAVRLGVGTNGQLLRANSAASEGVDWHTLSHTELTNIGTNTHSQIDTHIADSTIHFTQAAISIPSTQITDFNEAAQDAVGGILTDSSTIDFTYTDGSDQITASVIQSGISHTNIADIGTNTHAQIDTAITNSTNHIASTSNPHSVTIDQITPTTTKGDIIAENGTNAVRLAVGTNGQVLSANSATATGLEWITNVASISYSQVTATTDTSTNSATAVTMTTMTTTPAAGTWLVTFSASGNVDSNGADGTYAIYNNGTIVQHSERNQNFNGGAAASGFDSALHTNAIVTTTGAETIDIRYAVSAGNFVVHERSLTFLKLA